MIKLVYLGGCPFEFLTYRNAFFSYRWVLTGWFPFPRGWAAEVGKLQGMQREAGRLLRSLEPRIVWSLCWGRKIRKSVANAPAAASGKVHSSSNDLEWVYSHATRRHVLRQVRLEQPQLYLAEFPNLACPACDRTDRAGRAARFNVTHPFGLSWVVQLSTILSLRARLSTSPTQFWLPRRDAV